MLTVWFGYCTLSVKLHSFQCKKKQRSREPGPRSSFLKCPNRHQSPRCINSRGGVWDMEVGIFYLHGLGPLHPEGRKGTWPLSTFLGGRGVTKEESPRRKLKIWMARAPGGTFYASQSIADWLTFSSSWGSKGWLWIVWRSKTSHMPVLWLLTVQTSPQCMVKIKWRHFGLFSWLFSTQQLQFLI